MIFFFFKKKKVEEEGKMEINDLLSATNNNHCV